MRRLTEIWPDCPSLYAKMISDDVTPPSSLRLHFCDHLMFPKLLPPSISVIQSSDYPRFSILGIRVHRDYLYGGIGHSA